MFTEEIFLVKEANTSNLKANTLKKNKRNKSTSRNICIVLDTIVNNKDMKNINKI